MAAFTSSDEFDLERRVWMTNEIPPYDMYKSLHSAMKTPFWKWIIGTANVGYDYPYKVLEEGKGYVHDTDSEDVYLKMTNGYISDNYGPQTDESTYNRLEIDGVLTPEFDLFLHEIYRYTETLYPDHPDERYLLTNTEFNDMILAAADMIDYSPNVFFFEKVASTLSNDLSSSEILDEAAKIKIRNLTNEAFRRKLYGSKAGYRMLANDIFQMCTIFPAATYLPLKEISKERLNLENKTLNSKEALNALNMSTDEYIKHNRQNHRIIDTYSSLYYRKFRLVDWNGQNSSYLQKEDTNTYFYGYSIPFNENRIFEYPNNGTGVSEIEGVITGSYVENINDPKGITYITEKNTSIYITNISPIINNDTVLGSESTSSTNVSAYIETSHDNYIPYINVYIYNNVKDIIDLLKDNEASLDNYAITLNNRYNVLNTALSGYNYIEYLYKELKKVYDVDELKEKSNIEDLKVLLNPVVDNTLLLEPHVSLSFYPSTINVEETVDNYYKLEQDIIIDKYNLFGRELGNVDLTDVDSGLETFYYISNFTKGKVTYTPRSILKYFAEQPTIYGDSRYSFIIENKNGKKVVLTGKLRPNWLSDGSRYYVGSVTLEITAIPEEKDDNLIKACYSDASEMFYSLERIKEDEVVFLEYGMTYDCCEDIIGLYNCEITHYEAERTKVNGLLETPYQAIQRVADEIKDDLEVHTTAAISCEDKKYFFYKASQSVDGNNIIALGTSAITYLEDAVSIYKDFSGVDYSNFIVIYIQKKTYEEALVDYRKNREYLYETAEKYETKEIYEVGSILPGCTVTGILEMYLKAKGEKDYSLLASEYDEGLITQISLGSLNVLPLIDNSKEMKPFTNDNGVIELESCAKEYKYGKNNQKSIYYPEYSYYSNNKHPSEIAKFNDGDKIYINNNYQAYSKINGSYLTNQKEVDSQDWFASYDGTKATSTNITCTPIKTYPIEIEGVVDVATENMEDIISFNSDLARERMKSLSIGDTVFGPTLDTDDNNIYITYVGDNYIKVNHTLQQSGTFVFTFNCKLNIISKDISEDMTFFRDELDNNGIYSIINPFEHGLWGSDDFPHASNAILESLPDIIFYEPYNYNNGFRSSFDEVMEKIHPLYDSANNKRLPSTIKFSNDLFIEYNITKYTNQQTRTGVSPSLITVDCLDYMSSSLGYTSRATDKANVGVNLMMETDTTGYYTLDTDLVYTDPNVALKFITLNLDGMNMWANETLDSQNDWTVPAYAQIGNGGSGRLSWFKSPADITYPTIWGNAVYDSDNITAEEVEDLELNNGKIRRRSVWGKDEAEDTEDTENDTRYTSIEKPIFEIPLGEYDIQTRYIPEKQADISRACTTVQASFYQENFNKLTKYMDPSDISGQSIAINNNAFLDTSPIEFIRDEDITYKGIWTPTKEKVTDGDNDYYKVVYPINVNNGDYFVITEDAILTNIGENRTTETFNNHTILFYKNNSWVIYKLSGIGLYGNKSVNELSGLSLGLSILHDKPIGFLDSILHRALVANGSIIYDSSTLKNNFATTYLSGGSIDYKNTIIWYIYLGSMETAFKGDADFESLNLKEGDVFGLVIPSTYTLSGNDAIFDYKLIKLNKCYFTTTLKFNRLAGSSDKELKYIYNGDLSLFKNLSKGITEIDLPRKCITEGSYNFDYIIDPNFIAEGYLYSSSISNEKGLEGYDIIENDNFDIVDKTNTVSFNITRGAIYKDDVNDEYYVWTDKVNGQKYDKLKKVALKFAEQKYFKNTLYITGAYTVKNEQKSGSADIVETPTLETLTGINEFTASYLSSGDRILKVTPITLRSIYSEYLEPTFFSNYKNYDAEILGIDGNNNIVLTYDRNNSKASFIKNNFILNLSQFAPVDKSFSIDAGKYVTEKYDTNYYNFKNPSSYNSVTGKDFLPPNVTFNKVTKSMLSDNKADNAQVEFKYFKNLLLAKVGISLTNPNVIYPAEDDSGQFQLLAGYVNNGDKIVEGISLRGSADKETLTKITLEVTNSSVPALASFVAYDELTKNFMAISKQGIGYFAKDVNLSSTSKVEVEAYQIDDIVSDNTYVDGLSIDNSDPLNPYWTIRVSDSNGSSMMYSVPFNYALNDKGHISSSGLFCTLQQLNNKEIPSVIKVSEVSTLSYDAATDTGSAGTVNKYISAEDFCVAEIRDDDGKLSYINKPFMVGDNSKLDEVPKALYVKDTNSDYAVFMIGRDIYIKSPNYYCDANGTYTTDITSDFYWKNTSAPISRDTLEAVIASKIKRGTESAGYDYVVTRWEGFKNNWDFLFTVDLVGKDLKDKISNNGVFSTEPKLTGTGISEGDYKQWKSDILSNVGEDVTYDYMVTLQTLIKKASDIIPLPWTVISDTLKKAKDDGKVYYLAMTEDNKSLVTTDKTKLLYKSKRPWDTSSATKTKIPDYLSIEYNADDEEFEINHYGIGKLYKNSTVNYNNEEVEVPFYYDIDASFQEDEPTMTWRKTFSERSWYAEYLYLLDSFVYLDADFENLFREKVEKVLFSKDDIVFICKDCTIISIPKDKTYKVEDLKDIDNWNIADIDEKYSYTVPDFDGTKSSINKTIVYYRNGEEIKDITVKLRMINQHPKIFEIKTAYSDSNIMLLGGYIKSMDTIDKEYGDAYGTELQENEGYQNKQKDNKCATFFKKSVYPFLLYSQNGGSSFEVATIDPDLPGCSLEKDGTKIVASSNVNLSRPQYKEPTRGMIIDGIHYLNGEYKFHLIGEDSKDVNYQLYPQKDTAGSISWKDVIKYEDIDDNESDVKSSYEEFYRAFELFIFSDSDYFIRASYIGLNLSDASVRSASVSSIIFDSALTTKQQTGGRIEALVAFKTKLAITPDKQISVIDKFSKSDYIEGDGFKISSYIPVDNIKQADRMFNYREILTTAEKELDDTGYRAVSEDVDHKYYKWNTCVNTNNEEVYTIKNATNSNEMDILLCDARGNYITNNGTTLYTYTSSDLLDSEFDPSLLAKAGDPVYPSLEDAESDPSLRINDPEFNSFDKTIIAELNFADAPIKYSEFGLNGKSVLKTGDYIVRTCIIKDDKVSFIYEIKDGTTTFDDTYTALADTTDVNTILASDLPEGTTSLSTYAKYVGSDVVVSEPCMKVQISNAEVENYRSYLYEVDTDKELLNSFVLTTERTIWETASAIPYATFESRFEERQIGNKKYYYDKKLNAFPFKKRRYLNIDIYTDYALVQDQAIYTKTPFTSITTGSQLRTPVTGVFLPQKGYGGLRNRVEYNASTGEGNSWSDELPWDLDPVAFENSYLKNTNGDYIKLCNSAGIAIDSNNGETICKQGNTYDVYYKDIAYGESKTIDILKFNNTIQEDISDITIYRPESATAYIWLSSDKANVNYTNAVGTKQDLLNIKFVIPSQFMFTDVFYTIETSDDKQTWEATNDFICENGILKYVTPETTEYRPKYLRISYTHNRRSLSEIISLTSSIIENTLYDNLVPIWYYKDEDLYKVLENASLTFVDDIEYDDSQATFTAGKVLESVEDTITVTVDGDNLSINKPIFNIGECKLFTNPNYKDNTYEYKFFISDYEYVSGNITYTDDSSDTKTVKKQSSKLRASIEVESYIENNVKVLKAIYRNGNNEIVLDTITLNAFTVPSCYLTVEGGTFVPVDNTLYQESNIDIVLKVNGTVPSDTFIKGTISPIYMRTPKYPNFSTLIAAEQYIVNNPNVYYDYNTTGTYMQDVTFNNVETNKVTFNKPLSVSELNDGKTHYIRMEILTQASVTTDSSYCNDPEHYIEVSLSEINDFPPDRVFFNESGYPKSPITIDNTIYRIENNVYYTNDNFTNNNGHYIMECDEDGKLIHYYISGGELKSRPLIANESISNAFVPLRPNYMSCKEWFYGEFYIKGKESNPFWQVINLSPSFNSISQEWTQNISINKYEKVGTALKKVKLDSSESYTTISQGSSIAYEDGDIIQEYNTKYLDLFNGIIRFVLTQPAQKYYDNMYLNMYGLNVQNSFYHKSYEESEHLPGYLQSTYTVNSRKNFANEADSDSSIVEITEFGLFNKAHQLLAYAVFPPIEYRTDSQHASFTCFIKYGACTVN